MPFHYAVGFEEKPCCSFIVVSYFADKMKQKCKTLVHFRKNPCTFILFIFKAFTFILHACVVGFMRLFGPFMIAKNTDFPKTISLQ